MPLSLNYAFWSVLEIEVGSRYWAWCLVKSIKQYFFLSTIFTSNQFSDHRHSFWPSLHTHNFRCYFLSLWVFCWQKSSWKAPRIALSIFVMKPDHTKLVTCGHFWFMPFETNVMIWFQYVFYCNIEAGRNFETYIASTFGIEPSSSTNVTGWELVTHYSLKSLLSTERQIQFMQILPSGTKTKLNEEFPWAQKNLIQNSEYHENYGPT